MTADPHDFPCFSADSQSLVKQHLTKTGYAALKHLETRSGFTLDKAIRSGIENPDSAVGIYAGDAEAYDLFSPVFRPIITAYHHTGTHAAPSALTPADIPDPDPEGSFVISTRIRLARNLRNYSFPCHMPLDERKAVENKAIDCFRKFLPPLSGTYLSYETADRTLLSQLHRAKLGFNRGDRFMESAGLNRDFPKTRGVFYSRDEKFLVWVHEEDHLRIISMEKSSRIDRVFERLCRGVHALDSVLSFARHPELGYLTSCPTNLGTTMRAGVHIRLEKLDRRKALLDALIRKFDLQIRGTSGEKTRVSRSVFDISNRRRLGVSETDIVTNLARGVREIIQAEKTL